MRCGLHMARLRGAYKGAVQRRDASNNPCWKGQASRRCRPVVESRATRRWDNAGPATQGWVS